MTVEEIIGPATHMVFHSPMTEERGNRIAADLAGQWLPADPDHPDAAEVRDRLDRKRSIWLRGHRDHFGFSMLTLGVPA